MDSVTSPPGYAQRSAEQFPEAIHNAVGDKRGRRTVLGVVATVPALILCIYCNFSLRLSYEGGGAILQTTFFPRNSRLERAYGWPNDVFVQLNWAEVANGTIVADETLRPFESTFNPSAILKNGLVGVTLMVGSYLLAVSALDRRFSLRSFLLVIFCIAVLLAFLQPWIRDEIERQRQIREYEQWTSADLFSMVTVGLE